MDALSIQRRNVKMVARLETRKGGQALKLEARSMAASMSVGLGLGGLYCEFSKTLPTLNPAHKVSFNLT
jgi:hypothetical protein